MEHVITTLLIGFLAGLNTFMFTGFSIKSKALETHIESKLKKYIKGSKETAFSLIAGFSIFIPAIYGTTSQPKYVALFIGTITWGVIAIYSGLYWHKKYPTVFQTKKENIN